MTISERLRQSARRSVNRAAQIATDPARAAGAPLLRRYPGMGDRVAGWSWLWQPGWSRRHHERFYGTGDDPYHFDSEPYEQQKYARLLEALGDRRFSRASEVGCSEGAFTEMLSPSCDELVAVDISETALERARARLAARVAVRFERRTLPFDCPEGPFDLVVCADILYFWPRAVLEMGLSRLRERLAPGAVLLLLHYLGDFGQPVSATLVHELAARPAPGLPALSPQYGRTWEGADVEGAGYRLDLLVRQPCPAIFLRRGARAP
jgi:SAM-dependent methyltransferase